jgi:hypothetical protein
LSIDHRPSASFDYPIVAIVAHATMARDYQKTKENKRKAAAMKHASYITRLFVDRRGLGGDKDTPRNNAHDNGANETVSNAEGNESENSIKPTWPRKTKQ